MYHQHDPEKANTCERVQQKIAASGSSLAATVQAHPGSSAAGVTTLCPECQLHELGTALPATLSAAVQPQSLPFPGPAAFPPSCSPPTFLLPTFQHWMYFADTEVGPNASVWSMGCS